MKLDPHGLLRSFLAIGGGFLVCAAGVAMVTTLTSKWGSAHWRAQQQVSSMPAMLLNLLVSCGCALLGGAVAGLLAPVQPLLHALTLAIAILVLAGIASAELPRNFSLTYRLALIALPPIAALAGGILLVLLR